MFNLNPKNHIYILTDDNWVKKFRESRSSIGRTAKGKNNNKKKETTRTHDWEISSSDSIASFYVNSCPSGYNEHPRLFLLCCFRFDHLPRSFLSYFSRSFFYFVFIAGSISTKPGKTRNVIKNT